MQQLTIGKNQAGQRLDKFLKKAFPNAGTGFLYKMLRKKNITLNSSAFNISILVFGSIIYLPNLIFPFFIAFLLLNFIHHTEIFL